MNLTIESAVKDCLTREWSVAAIVNGKSYKYVVSDYDYERVMREYRNNKPGVALNLLKGVK